MGKTIRVEPIPEDQLEAVQTWRERLFDVLTAHDDQDRITSAYLEGKEIPTETIRALLREQTVKRLVQPVLCGSGREHIGVQPLLDAVTYYLPSPLDRPPVVGVNPKKKDKEEKRSPDPEGAVQRSGVQDRGRLVERIVLSAHLFRSIESRQDAALQSRPRR